MPSAHVHGITIDPTDGAVLLATHDGLFRLDEWAGAKLVSPAIDLMGFAVAGSGRFLASGHPGPGVDLPQPVGLIESTDGGATWQTLSRAGQSDFHALAVSDGGLLGFDGSLWSSADGLAWDRLSIPAQPHSLASAPDGQAVLATTESGVLRSTDAGRTWDRIPDAPLLQVLAWGAGDTVVGATPSGQVAVSTDAGGAWTIRGSLGAAPQAVAVATTAHGDLRILVVTTQEVLESFDGGATFSALRTD